MNFLLTSITSIFFFIAPHWLTDFSQAKKEAATSHKLILINFSGSDWCGPCIRMKRELFGSETFEKFAADNLILLNADFPRSKKNQLNKEQINKNELLADVYNKNGKFPLTVLVTSEGKVLKEWDGLPDETASKFVSEINSFVNAAK